MRKGQPFFSIAMPHPVHRRMTRMLRAFGADGEFARSRWELTCAVVGEERALSLGWTKAKHLSERIIASAERNGFMRRLPVLTLAKYPTQDDRRHGELSYVITEDGLSFRERQDKYERWLSAGESPGAGESWRRERRGLLRSGKA
jgi:hypothetical protein